MAKPVIWSTEARADIRALDRDTALRLLKALASRPIRPIRDPRWFGNHLSHAGQVLTCSRLQPAW
ncbi:MAG TPA: hypothetical protein DEQ47_00485 [Solibacterales bacterium]|nr:hypothetical protein [Bryobacterales bacterium]